MSSFELVRGETTAEEKQMVLDDLIDVLEVHLNEYPDEDLEKILADAKKLNVKNLQQAKDFYDTARLAMQKVLHEAEDAGITKEEIAEIQEEVDNSFMSKFKFWKKIKI